MTKARDLASAAPAPSTVSATELGYLDGVSSAIQTQLDGKQAANANVSTTELGYLDGVTSAIQTQLDGKSGTAHNHDSAYVNQSVIDAKGDLLVGTADNTYNRLAVGADNTILTADSSTATGLKWAAPSGGASGLTYVGGASFTNATATNVDNVFSSTYQNYRVILSITGISAYSSRVELRLRAGGSNNNTNYTRGSMYMYRQNSGTTAAAGYTTTEGFWWAGYFDPGYSTTNTLMYYCVFDVINPNQNRPTVGVASFMSTYGDSPEVGSWHSTFWHRENYQATGISVNAQGADGFTGNVRIYGYANS